LKIYKGRQEDGFTLIEIMVVVFVIGVLAAISFPVFNAQKKKAIHATLVSDVKNAGLVMQSELFMTDDVYSMLLPNFFKSQEGNAIQINHLQSSADFFCIVGTNTTYNDMFVYYDSAKGGMVDDAKACGGEGSGDTGTSDPAEIPVATNPINPTPVETPPPSSGGVAGETVTAPKPGDANYIPPEMQIIMNTPVPNNVCQAKITENIEAYAAMYASLKYQNLVSVMARLQSGNKDMADILKNTPEGKRAIAASKALELDKTCSKYVSLRSTATTYYFEDYDELTKTYIEFMNNLTANSADSFAYTKAYKKLYYRVYGV
jgi:prepilin-type N-terminal cleavage/methylation domain-containing protein